MGRRSCLAVGIVFSLTLLLIVVSCGACWAVDWDTRSRDLLSSHVVAPHPLPGGEGTAVWARTRLF